MNKLEKFSLVTKKMAPYIFAHHPLCTYYTKDMVQINKYFFCKGCLLTYIPFILGIFFGLILTLNLRLTVPKIIASWAFLLCWSIIVVIFFILKDILFIHRIKTHLRIGLFSLSGILFASLLISHGWFSIILAYILANIFSIVIIYFRYQNLNKTCLLCPEMPYRGKCSGFRPYLTAAEDIEGLLMNRNSVNDLYSLHHS